MCGICGFIDYKRKLSEIDLSRMEESISYRGPDDRGIFIDNYKDVRIGFGHVRLSILDLSTAGHQPMSFANDTIVYNGEIYNFKEIRTELEKRGHVFYSNCDTEVILHAFYEWGKECVRRFIGMFTFTIYDKLEGKVFFCRDRAGIKPLYYSWCSDLFVFGSELKCLMSLKEYKRVIDKESLSLFLQLGFIPSPKTIFENTYKLEPGHWLIFDLNNKTLTDECYWDVVDCYKQDKLAITYDDAVIQLKEILKSAFGYRMISDVPVGVFLSGGYDSSLLASILVKELGVTPKTFTIGFREGNNEAPDAEEISQILGTEHTTFYCDIKEAKEIIPYLSLYYDEPFSDISGIPTILVSKLAKQQVSVALSADGGDEVFAGYYAYDKLTKYYPIVSKIPTAIQKIYKGTYKLSEHILPNEGRITHLATYLDTFYKSDLSVRGWTLAEFSSYENVAKRLLGRDFDYESFFVDDEKVNNRLEFRLLFDYKYRMADEFLTKVDRATMSVSLEGREPLMDHRIVEFVARLPWEYKYMKGFKKRIERDLVHSYLPEHVMNKPKRGFTIPLNSWLRNDLAEYSGEMLMSESLGKCGLIKSEVQNLYNNFLSGNNYHSNVIWRLVQLSSWYNRWMS